MTRAVVNVAPPQQAHDATFLSSFMSMPFFFRTTPPPSFTFINPVTGSSFSQHDLLTPLRDIYLIFNNTNVSSFPHNNNNLLVCFMIDHVNIWANIQETGEPFRMHFDLSRAAHWLPFFTNKFPLPPLPSVQVLLLLLLLLFLFD